ncbi:hypothetical protein PIB30_082260 [Stylosanthes scabra]|uniref:Secreted protein n=1 Tax=Stylosanthes scabra TaxID=79078 RepID=A0ABU6YTR7_9FABA|nr:hypothetical protein [Stylosanthes scabra]
MFLELFESVFLSLFRLVQDGLLLFCELFRSFHGFRGQCSLSGLPLQELSQSCFQLLNGMVPLIDLLFRGRLRVAAVGSSLVEWYFFYPLLRSPAPTLLVPQV